MIFVRIEPMTSGLDHHCSAKRSERSQSWEITVRHVNRGKEDINGTIANEMLYHVALIFEVLEINPNISFCALALEIKENGEPHEIKLKFFDLTGIPTHDCCTGLPLLY